MLVTVQLGKISDSSLTPRVSSVVQHGERLPKSACWQPKCISGHSGSISIAPEYGTSCFENPHFSTCSFENAKFPEYSHLKQESQNLHIEGISGFSDDCITCSSEVVGEDGVVHRGLLSGSGSAESGGPRRPDRGFLQRASQACGKCVDFDGVEWRSIGTEGN